MATEVGQIAEAIIGGDQRAAVQLVHNALNDNEPARRILEEGLLAGMAEVGRRFREGEYFIPEVLISAEAMKAATLVLRPQLAEEGAQPMVTAVIGTVKGDLHDIGKNLVGIMLEGVGFEVVDLGVDVSAEGFVDACRQQRVDLVGLSALLTTTMPRMESIVSALRDALTDPPVILVGGAPLSASFAETIRADGYGRDAASGAELAKKLCLRRAS